MVGSGGYHLCLWRQRSRVRSSLFARPEVLFYLWMSTSQPPPYTVEDGIGTHNPWKTVFWIKDNGTKCLLISATRFLPMDRPTYPRWVSHFYLRFSRVAEYHYKERHDIRCQIRASMLSLDTMYAASLVFKYREQPNKDLERLKLITIKWKMEELSMQHEKNEEDIDDDDDDEYWENKLPNDYQRLIQRSDKPLHYTNKKDLYMRLCEGFLGDNGQLWFSLCKSIGGICSTLPATSILHDDYNYKRLDRLSLPESRFGEVRKLQEAVWYTFECRLQSHMFSPQCIYACFLVFKFEDDHIQPDDTCSFKAWYNLDDVLGDTFFAHLNSSSINIPTIKPKNDYRSHDLSNILRTERVRMPKHNIERLVDSMMEERGDGWMEVMLCKPLHQLQDHKSLRLSLSKSKDGSFSGIIVEGVEFRPVGYI
ncbi:kinase-like domain, phloem protein 2-like protein [Tanacetum coccineum]